MSVVHPTTTAVRLPAQKLSALLAAQERAQKARQTAEGILAEAHREASEIVEAARQQAEEMLETAQSNAEQERSEILTEARRDARAIRLTEAAEAAGRLTERFDALSPWLGDLVLDCLAKLLGTMEAAECQRAILAQALLETRRDWMVCLHVDPDSAESLRALVAERGGPDGPFRAVTEVIEDPRLSPGECLLESEAGFVEIGLEAQIEALRKVMLPVVLAPADKEEDPQADEDDLDDFYEDDAAEDDPDMVEEAEE